MTRNTEPRTWKLKNHEFLISRNHALSLRVYNRAVHTTKPSSFRIA